MTFFVRLFFIHLHSFFSPTYVSFSTCGLFDIDCFLKLQRAFFILLRVTVPEMPYCTGGFSCSSGRSGRVPVHLRSDLLKPYRAGYSPCVFPVNLTSIAGWGMGCRTIYDPSRFVFGESHPPSERPAAIVAVFQPVLLRVLACLSAISVSWGIRRMMPLYFELEVRRSPHLGSFHFQGGSFHVSSPHLFGF